MVSVGKIKTSDAKLVAVNDVIRITIQADYTATGDIALDATTKASACSGGSDGPWATIESLNGSIKNNNTVTLKDGAIEIAQALATQNDYSTYPKISSAVAGTATGANPLTISFDGIDKLKAGDVITISLQSCTAADPTIGDKSSLRLQVGANAGQEINLSINSMKAKDLGIVRLTGSVSVGSTEQVNGQALDVTSQSKASLAIEAYDSALQKVSTERAKLGAVQNRLEHTIANLDTSEENLQSAESRIRDVDMADEMTSYSKSNILQQAGTSMLAQANQSNQTVLSLLS
jgi:flagellin